MAVLVRVAVLVAPVAMAMGSEDGEGPREPYVTFQRCFHPLHRATTTMLFQIHRRMGGRGLEKSFTGRVTVVAFWQAAVAALGPYLDTHCDLTPQQ